MHAITAFDNRQTSRFDTMRSRKIAGMAIPRTILHDISGNERSQHLFFESFPIDIASRFGEPFRSALFRAQEKIVHMQHIAVETTLQQSRQRGFARRAWPVDRHKHMLAFRKHTFDAFDHGPRVLNRLRLLHVFHGFLRFLGFHHRRLRAHYSSTVKRYAREPSPSSSAYSSVCSPCLVAIRSVTDAPSGAT